MAVNGLQGHFIFGLIPAPEKRRLLQQYYQERRK
jgi:hypothetical protein